MHPSITKPSAGTNQTEGFEQQSQQDSAHSAPLGSEDANEVRIRELAALMDAAAAAGDLATYKQRQAEYTKALSTRRPEQVHRLNELHLIAVERAAALGRTA